MLVVFTGLKRSTNSYAAQDLPEKVFMGFGYNPDLAWRGERLDMLDFFSWMRKLQEMGVKEWVIWDASGFWIVNKTPKKKIVSLDGNLSGEKVLEILINEQDRPKRADIKRNCDLRSRYLQRLIGISEINGRYVDSRSVFRVDGRYALALDAALAYIEKLKMDNPELVRRVCPSTDNPTRELYLPLEVAEAIYLEEIYGVDGKLGPETEKFFDEIILEVLEKNGIPYQTLRCPLGTRRPGYLSDENVLWTQSPDNVVVEILGSDILYRDFIAQYMGPFRGNTEKLEDCVIRMRDALNSEGGCPK